MYIHYFNKPFVTSLLSVLKKAFPTNKELPRYMGQENESDMKASHVQNMIIWFIMNRDNNRAGDLLKIEGDIVYFDLGDSFSIRPLTCGLYFKEGHVLDFTTKSQREYTDLFGAWAEIVETTNPDLARTLRVVGKRDISYDDEEPRTLNLSRPVIGPEMAGFLLKDPEVPTHPAGLVDHGEVIWSPEELNKAEPPRTGDYVLRGSDIFRITNSGDEVEEVKTRTFHNSDIYGPLLNFLCALGTSVFPAVALDKLSRIKDCTYSLRVGGGRIYQLEVVVDDWKVTFDWDSEAVDWGHSNPPISLTVIDNLAQKIIIYQASTIAALLEGM